MNPQKVKNPIFCHSGESRARSEALALSSHFNSFWTPAFAGVTELRLFTISSDLGFSLFYSENHGD